MLDVTIHYINIRIILTYMDCCKQTNGPNFRANRRIQEKIERYMMVDPGVHLVCLGDFNGRVKALEPRIETDPNGKMNKHWVNTHGMHHLNQSGACTGTYTYGRPGKPRSAIDLIMVDTLMEQKYRGMDVNENGEQLNISDHNLIRSWYRISHDEKTKWE